ncbi:MAG: DUF2339 domain-containing protein [Candidatus Hydrogenedentes bacterium]|nr:DUF2339 domain-containing protein [Candidatus Hydrogenedentota bacterium]
MGAAILLALVVVGGLVAGYVGMFRSFSLGRRVKELEDALRILEQREDRQTVPAPETRAESPPASSAPAAQRAPIAPPPMPAEPVVTGPRPVPTPPPAPVTVRVETPATLPPAPVTARVAPSAAPAPALSAAARVETAPPGAPKPPAMSPEITGRGLEMMLGMRGIVWAGVAMMLVASAFFLKMAFDNAWIGPAGRLAMTAAASLAAMGLGQLGRRRGYRVIFYSLSGGGLAGLYGAVFASVHLYSLLSPGAALPLAVLVTLGAVGLSVWNGAEALALIALLGGYASPVLLSTGENRPDAFFPYLFVLSLVAFGTSLARRWRWVNVTAFTCVTALYQMWHVSSFSAEFQRPAVMYAMLFYVFFLLVPTVFGLVRRAPGRVPEMTLVAVNAAHGFYALYMSLHTLNPGVLGWLLAAQALFALALYLLWTVRVRGDRPMAECLLVVAILLMLAAVPVQMRVYGIPLMWALQGFALVFIAGRFQNFFTLAGGALALLLAAGGLLYRLPMHDAPFRLAFNAPFASWMLVTAAWAAAAVFAGLRPVRDWTGESRAAAGGFAVGALALLGAALSLEFALAWEFNGAHLPLWPRHRVETLIALWSVMTLVTAGMGRRAGGPWRWAGLAPVVVALAAAQLGFRHWDSAFTLLFLNEAFLPYLLLMGVLLAMAGIRFRSRDAEEAALAAVLECAAVVLLAVTTRLEFIRWAGTLEGSAPNAGPMLAGAAWAVEGLTLTALGLRPGRAHRAVAGLLLLSLAVGGLFTALPMHADIFRPLANLPFLCWVAVAACWGVAARLLRRSAEIGGPASNAQAGNAAAFACLMLCGFALHFEADAFWRHVLPQAGVRAHNARLYASMLVIWPAIALTAARTARDRGVVWRGAALVPAAIGVLAALGMLFDRAYLPASSWLFLNDAFLPWMGLVAALCLLARADYGNAGKAAAPALGLGAAVLAAAALALEMPRWAGTLTSLDSRVGISLVSAAWAVEAFALIWLGLRFRRVSLRAGGMALFAVTMGKVILFDTSTLLQYQRVLSWMACGMLLVVAGWVYHLFSARLLEEDAAGSGHAEQ